MQRRRIDETAWLKSNQRFKRYWKLIKLILFALLVCLNRPTHLNWFHLRNSTKAAKLDRIRSCTFFFSVLTFAYFLYFRQGLSWYRIGIGKFSSKISFFSLLLIPNESFVNLAQKNSIVNLNVDVWLCIYWLLFRWFSVNHIVRFYFSPDLYTWKFALLI